MRQEPDPVLSVVVLSWNTREHTLACMRALASDGPRHSREVVLVDNGSDDGTADAVERGFPTVRVHRLPVNVGWSRGNDAGARLARGSVLCLLNSDAEPRPGALDRLVDFLAGSWDHGAVAPRLVGSDGRTQRACRRLPRLVDMLVSESRLARVPPGSWIDAWLCMSDFDHLHDRDVEQPPGACLVLRRDEYTRLGGLDPALFLFFGDVDLCRRLRAAGRRIRYLASAEVLHHGGVSTHRNEATGELWRRDLVTYAAKHHGRTGSAWARFALTLRGLS